MVCCVMTVREGGRRGRGYRTVLALGLPPLKKERERVVCKKRGGQRD